MYDFIIIGGGIVGLTAAYRFSKYKVLVLEKESEVATHQTGRNSGVIHSGIYYKPGSVKAETCRLGKKILEDWCAKNEVPINHCGKVIVATNETEFEKLDDLYQRGQANGVQCQLIDQQQLQQIEPYCSGKRAIHVPETGIIDFKEVCHKLAQAVEVETFQEVLEVNKTFVITDKGSYEATHVINCAGLYSDVIARKSGVEPNLQIVPFKGKYYTLKGNSKKLCKTLIYPVPDPQFPFLGVHFTTTIHGEVEVGPNAVLALGREAYDHVNLKETWKILNYRGALKLFKKHWKMGLKEIWMSISRAKYLKELQKLVPGVQFNDLVPRDSGIRAQAVDKDGNLVDDFRFIKDGNVLHVLNAPSPAATASFAIAEKIASYF
jgi:L-2-hydroxyglutarate oxidase